jgi:Cytochrome C1 family
LLTIAYQDYLFSLLTGYVDPPAGVEIREGMNYNPYFPGGAISMPRVLFDGLVEYDDGMYLYIKSVFFFGSHLTFLQVLLRPLPRWPRTLPHS